MSDVHRVRCRDCDDWDQIEGWAGTCSIDKRLTRGDIYRMCRWHPHNPEEMQDIQAGVNLAILHTRLIDGPIRRE